MKYNYIAKFRLNLAKAITEIDDIVNNINDTLSKCGLNEKMSIHADIFEMNISVDRRLTKDEENTMKTILSERVSETFIKYEIKMTSFSRKSGKSKQSVK